MAFKFRLEKVLDYRRQLEEQAMQALAQARARREAEAARLEGLQSERALQMAKLQNSAALDGAERWLIQNYVRALHFEIEESRALLLRLEEEVALRQKELVTRAQERELLDRLKSKQAKRFAEEEKLREQRDNDETATIRYGKETV